MSTTINRDTLNQAQSLLDQGKVHEAWQVLGDAGDNYALTAAQVTDKNNESLLRTFVKEAWENTVGVQKYNEKFDAVAEDHLTNYIKSIKDINGEVKDLDLFVLPSTEDIEKSYKSALSGNGISTKAAIDGIINTVISGTGLPGWADWLDLFDGKWSNDYDIEDSRISDPYLKTDYTRFEAVEKVIKIGTESAYDESGLDYVKNYLDNLYGDSKSFLQNLFSKQIEDQQSNLNSSQIDNSLLKLEINTDLTSNFRSDNITQTGIVIGGADWSASMLTINDDGYKNVAPGGILSDYYRPGNQELSSYEIFSNQVKSDLDRMSQELRGDYSQSFNLKIQAPIIDLSNLMLGSRSLTNIDPLVLDLDGDGVKLISYQNSEVIFDVDNDGKQERTGWVSGRDGIIVDDKNHNNKIDNITETISEYYNPNDGSTSDAEGKYSLDGLDALKKLDSNNDNKFNDQDQKWNDLKVWVDANEDGITDAGELKTLNEAGIKEINLTRVVANKERSEGNIIFSRSTYTTTSNQIKEVAAVDFTTNPVGYEFNDVNLGKLATAEDGTKSLVISNQNGETINLTNSADSLNQVANVFGNIGDDTIIGNDADNWLSGGEGSDILQGGKGDDILIIDDEDKQENIDGGEGRDVVIINSDEGIIFNLAQAHVETVVGGDGNDVLISGGTSNTFVDGGSGDDIIIGGAADDALSGSDGDDYIDGGYGNDVIRGHRGQDTLTGGEGDDYIDGGLDNDQIFGGKGKDILIGGRGSDEMDGGDGYDLAQFQGSYKDYKITRDGINYKVKDLKNGDIDSLKNIEGIRFSDLTVKLNQDNIAPLAVSDVLTVENKNVIFISKELILQNDVDVDGDALDIYAVENAIGGTVKIVKGADEKIIGVEFTLDKTYNGVMSFDYSVIDARGLTTNVVQYQNDGTEKEAPMRARVEFKLNDDPNDPLYVKQWYLSEINIKKVWDDYTGDGIKIGIFETGDFNYAHQDLDNNTLESYKEDAEFRQVEQFSQHKTTVAGVIAAERNDYGIVGVSYGAKLDGYSWEADATGLENLSKVDIANNSWGKVNKFADNFLDENNPNQSYADLLEDAVKEGRGGLGTINVFAGGNSRAEGDNVNYHNLQNSRFVITTGSINQPGDLGLLVNPSTPFSNPGAAILVSAPGSNIDSTGNLLENKNGSQFLGEFSSNQGTSFSAPIVSGIVALMLQANPNLGYRDVQKILALSARKFDDATTAWQENGASNWNGGAMHFSNDYGYGIVDALAAVRLAETWKDVSNFYNEQSFILEDNEDSYIPDEGSLTKSFIINNSNLNNIETVEIEVNLTHLYLSDLRIKLISPSGTESILMDQPQNAFYDGNLIFNFSSRNFLGEKVDGTWKLEITDLVSGDVGYISDWKLKFYGALDDGKNDTYIYTNEFAKLGDEARAILSDKDGGVDTINAAAVSSDSVINLNAGEISNIAGRNFTISTNEINESYYQKQKELPQRQAELAAKNSALQNEQNILTAKQNEFNGIDAAIKNSVDRYNAKNLEVDTAKKSFDEIKWFGDYKYEAGIKIDGSVTYIYRNIYTGQTKLFYDNYNPKLQDTINTYNSRLNNYKQKINELNSIVAENQNLIARKIALPAEITEAKNEITNLTAEKNAIENDIAFINSYLNSFSGEKSLIENAYAGDGNDRLIGNDQDNQLWGGRGNNTETGGAGKDIFIIKKDESTQDIITDFTIGEDKIDLSDFKLNSFGDLNISQSGNDVLISFSSGQKIILQNLQAGQLLLDSFIGLGATSNLINGTDANDVLSGTNKDDLIKADFGNDIVNSGLGNDNIDGENGDDFLFGGLGNDIISGGAGNDVIYGDGDYDITQNLVNGFDTQSGNDKLYGGDGDDEIYGGLGNDYIETGDGNNFVDGGNGDDVILTSNGNQNDIFGGAGNDTFIISEKTIFSQHKFDVIYDFERGNLNEKIDLSIFANIDDFDDLQFIQVGVDAYVQVKISDSGYGQFVVLRNTNISDLTADNFIIKNAAPIVVADNAKTEEDTTITINILANDSDDKTASFTKDDVNIFQAQHGVVALNNDGTVTYTPNANFNGVDSFEYSITDSGGLTSQRVKVDIIVDAKNDAPLVISSVSDRNFFTTKTINFTLNNIFTEVDGEDLSYMARLADGSPLPDWLQFDANNLTFTGTAPDNAEKITVALIATDDSGLTTEVDFVVKIDDSIKFGSANDDNIIGDDAVNKIDAQGGNDTVEGKGANDIITGGLGDDILRGGAGDDVIFGDGGIDPEIYSITGFDTESGNDKIYGDDGDDNLLGGLGDDYIEGGTGNDTIFGGEGNDVIHGGDGDDLIIGEEGDDVIYGDAGENEIQAGAGNDIIYTGADTSHIWGEDGIDTFVINEKTLGQNDAYDIIYDFDVANEKIDLGVFKNIDQYSDFLISQIGEDTYVQLKTNDVGYSQYLVLVGIDAYSLKTANFIVKNDAPNAANDSAVLNEDNSVTINILANDLDDKSNISDLGKNNIVIATAALHGTVSVNNNGTVTYTPNANYNGSDFFEYTVSDLAGLVSNKARVNISINAVNDAPIVSSIVTDKSYYTNRTVNFNVSGIFSDVDNATLTYRATLADGSALPSWLQFNASSMTFSGLSPVGAANFAIKLTATDAGGLFATTNFNLNITDPVFFGTSGNDILVGTVDGEIVNAGDGQDTVLGMAGNDTLNGENGDDFLYGGAGDDTIYGGAGNDSIYGDGDLNLTTFAVDNINSQIGNDKLYGGDGNDAILGGLGNDYIDGGNGDDQIYGMDGNDIIFGGDGNDHIQAGAGDDIIDGGNGNQNDIWGEGGVDRFVILQRVLNFNHQYDVINDFDLTNEKIDLSALKTIDNYADLQFLQNGADAYINVQSNAFGYGQYIVLTGVDSTKLTANNFIITNNAPIAVNDSFALDEDVETTLNVIANDSDDKTALSAFGRSNVAIITQTTKGTLTINSNGTITYKPNANFNGSDFFEYQITDSGGLTSSKARVNLTINPVNDAPVLLATISDKTIFITNNFNFSLSNSFSEIEGEKISYSATLSDGSALPSWLSFDGNNATFSGSAPTTAAQLSLKITASDPSGNSTVTNFKLIISDNAALGGDGDDNITATKSGGVVFGGLGNDTLSPGIYDVTLDGGAGDDTLYGADSGRDVTLIGGNGADKFVIREGIIAGDIITDFDLANDKIDLTALNSGIFSGPLTDFSQLNKAQVGSDVVITFNSSKTLMIKNVTLAQLTADKFIGLSDNQNSTNNLTITGTSRDETLTGGSGDDKIDGYWGDDIINGNDGNDTLIGNDGDDIISGGLGNNTLTGGEDDDTFIISKNPGKNDYITDLEAFDNLQFSGFAASTKLSDFTYQVANSDVIFNLGDGQNLIFKNISLENVLKYSTAKTAVTSSYTGTSGNDKIILTSNTDGIRLSGGDGNDVISGGYGDAIINGGKGNDILRGNGWFDIFEIDKNPGDQDVIVDFKGGFGNRSIVLKGFASSRLSDYTATKVGSDAVIDLGDGQTLTLKNYDVSKVSQIPQYSKIIYGTNSAETINGTDESELIIGYDGNDVINGGKGNDVLGGEYGADLYIIDKNPGDYDQVRILEKGEKIILRGFGDDILSKINFVPSGYSNVFIVDLGDNQLLRILSDDSSVKEADIRNGSIMNVERNISGTEGNDVINGGSFDVELHGGAGDDIIYGGYLENKIYGENGNDVLYSSDVGVGADTLIGGLGIDTFVIRGNTIIQDLETNEKIDLSKNYNITSYGQLTITQSGADSVVKFNADNIGQVTLTVKNILKAQLTADKFIFNSFTGTAGDDVINGDNSNNTINGLGGNDVINGGRGSNTLTGGAGLDVFVISTNSGYTDTITDFDIASDKIDLSKTSLSANYFSDLKISQQSSDTLIQVGSSQTIILKNINYTTLTQNNFTGIKLVTDGNDVIVGDSYDNVLNGQGGDDIINGDFGNDTLYGGTGNDTLNGGYGNDSLYGDDGNDILSGDSGSNTLTGGAGLDTFVIASNSGYTDTITDFDVASDKIDLSKISNLGYFSDLNISQTAGDSLIQFASGQKIILKNFTANNLSAANFLGLKIATEGDDKIVGDSYDNVLYGYGGNDTINAGSGNDTLYGGIGNDNLYGEYGNDVIFGEDGNDYLNGGDGNDILDGGKGDDTLVGGTGNNNFSGGVGKDIFIIGPDVGTIVQGSDAVNTITDFDKVNDKIDITRIRTDLYFSDLQISQSGADAIVKIIGKTVTYVSSQIKTQDQQIIIKNTDATTLTRDNFIGLNAEAGVDAYVIDGSKFDDEFLAPYESLAPMLFGNFYSKNYILNGNAGNDYITGIDGNDILNGGDGEDVLSSSYGQDIFSGGTGIDQFVFTNYSGEKTTITDFDISNEKISFKNMSDVLTMSDLTITDGASGAVISYNLGKKIILQGISASQLTVDNFEFLTTQYDSNDIPQGTEGDDDIEYYYGFFGSGDVGAINIDAGGGQDKIYVYSKSPDFEIHAGSDDDYIDASLVGAKIYGDDGNDIIIESVIRDWSYPDYVEQIYGGNNEIHGGFGNDTIVIQDDNNNNIIYGDSGNDRFVIFQTSNGVNTIADFEVNNVNEKIDLSYTNSQFSDLNLSQDGSDAIVFLKNNQKIILNNVDAASLTQDNFIFAINGTSANDIINNVTKSSYVYAGDGNDEITAGGAYEEHLFGESGIDKFIIQKTPGSIVYLDDFALTEKIAIKNFAAIRSFSDITIQYQANQTGYDPVQGLIYSIQAFINLGDGQAIIIPNVAANALIESNFEFFYNTNPIANLTSISINEDVITNIDILASASDAENDVLTISNITAPNHGVAQIVSGKIQYTSNANYNGSDQLNYTISDGKGGIVTKTLNINITPVNDAPTATLTSATTNEDQAVTIDVLAFASDIEGDSLSIASVTNPTKGTASIANGKIIYTPNPNYNGSDQFTYTISDGNGGVTKTLNLNISQVNDAPTASLTSAAVNEDQFVMIDVLAQAQDIDGDILAIAGITNPTSGIAQILDGKIKYTPNANHNGSDQLTYTISDGKGGIVEKTLTISIAPVNDAPIATLTSATINEDQVTTIDVVAQAGDIDGDELSIKSVTNSFHGNVKIIDNKIIYTPNVNYNGSDQFTYTIADSSGATSTKTLTINIAPVNDAPQIVSNLGNIFVNEDEAKTAVAATVIDLSFKDVDNDKLTYSLNSDAPSWLSINSATGEIISTNPTNYDVGNYDIIITATDMFGLSVTQNFVLTVNNVNDAPTSSEVFATLTQDMQVSFNFDASDIDANDNLRYEIINPPSKGLVINNNDGTFTFKTNNDFEYLKAGEVEEVSFAYKAIDSSGVSSNISNVVITVRGTNDIPTATIITTITNEDNSVTIDVLSGTRDVEGDVLSISNITNPSNGTAQIVDGKIVYTPNANYNGSDQFNYTISDGKGGEITKSLAIDINAVNDAPTLDKSLITNCSAKVGEHFSYHFNSSAFADVDNDNLQFSVTRDDGSQLPPYLSFDSQTLELSGTPSIDNYGLQSFIITASDGEHFVSAKFNLIIDQNVVVKDDSHINIITTDANGEANTNQGTTDVVIGSDVNNEINYTADEVWQDSGFFVQNSYTLDLVSISGRGRSFDAFDGRKGFDSLNLTNSDDVLALDDPFSPSGSITSRISGIEIINGDGGNDIIDFSSFTYTYGDMIINGGSGRDVLWSNDGNDVINGFGGNDNIIGGRGDDILNGGSGDDIIKGYDDNDILNGGLGADILEGGNGLDIFLYSKIADSTSMSCDMIIDFMKGQDKIDLSALNEFDSINNFTISYNGRVDQTIIQDNNPELDFMIKLEGNILLNEQDFVF